MIWLKSANEIDKMRQAGRITEEALNMLREHIKPGISTNELDSLAEAFIKKHGAIPSFKDYRGYPKNICASINSVVVHGIPDNTVLSDGDIISIDIGVYYNGFHGDAARTFPVGQISQAAKDLIATTEASFFEGLKFAKVGGRLQDISATVQKTAESKGYGVVRMLVGHGIGRAMHEDPDVPNFGTFGKGIKLQEGLVIAIEPMINEGTYEVSVMPDGWTVKTADGMLSAHYENTVAITANGPELLTLRT